MNGDCSPLLVGWRSQFQDLDACPWPGPRPLRNDDQALLVGRDPTRQEFRRAIKPHRLLLFHGPSGVGKTSLMQAGLVPDLRRDGATVLVADQWGGKQRDSVRVYLAERLKFERLGLPASEGDPFAALNAAFSDRAVLVLDQFEELVRYSPVTAERVFELVLDINRRFETKVIVSFRSEYLHEFTALEEGAVNFSVTQFPLRELDDRAAEGVILAGNKKAPGAIQSDAAAWLAENWTSARASAREEVALDDPFGRVGLLHLQAMLYSLYFANEAQPLTKSAIAVILSKRSAGRSGGEADAGAFRYALQRAIEFKLDHCGAASCETEAEEKAMDASLSAGTRWMLRRAVTHLSSAGYKLIRSAQELAQLAMGVDYDTLHDGLGDGRHGAVSASQERALFETILARARVGEATEGEAASAAADLLEASRHEIAAEADSRGAVTGGDVAPWTARLSNNLTLESENDAFAVTCGPMMGLAPSDVFVEELRRFAFALVWLEASALVRVTTPFGSGAMVSLIHDGFGPALIHWAEKGGNDASGPLSAVTAPRGASFAWSLGPAKVGQVRAPAIDGRCEEKGHRILANLRWRGGWVQADLDCVAFLSCDFRGTLFDGCRLSGVTFVNCLLDGAIFSDCILSGRQSDVNEDEGWSETEPDFVVAAPPSIVRAHARQRVSGPAEQSAFLCDLPGAPAVPYHGEETATFVRFRDESRQTEKRRLDANLVDGGMAVYGGRISSLVMRACYLAEDSGVTFRHTTGSGLEFVEIVDSPGRLEVFGCAIRHISLSPQIDARESAVVRVQATGSALAQIWVGPRLRGSFSVSGCRLIQAWNGSPVGDGEVGLHFAAVGSGVFGLLDVVTDGRYSHRAQNLGMPGLSDQLHRMDYRRNPARLRDALRATDGGPAE